MTQFESNIVEFCLGLGYTMHIVDDVKDIPSIQREFPEALHVHDEIWVVNQALDQGFFWHEAGHAFISEIVQANVREGMHWHCNHGRESDEGFACSAAGALMAFFGLPQDQQDRINEAVFHHPHFDRDHASDHRDWLATLNC